VRVRTVTVTVYGQRTARVPDEDREREKEQEARSSSLSHPPAHSSARHCTTGERAQASGCRSRGLRASRLCPLVSSKGNQYKGRVPQYSAAPIDSERGCGCAEEKPTNHHRSLRSRPARATTET
jgi:hypothetical protein